MTDVQSAGVEHTARRPHACDRCRRDGAEGLRRRRGGPDAHRARAGADAGRRAAEQIVELLVGMVDAARPVRPRVGRLSRRRAQRADPDGAQPRQRPVAGLRARPRLDTALGKPVRIANDADLQGLAVIAGKGVEMVITLGTGFGTGLYLDGRLAPHLEIAHHPFRHGETYDEQLGNAARKAIGGVRWNRRVKKAIGNLRRLTTFDHLYVGGGNAKKIDFALDPDVTVVSNEAGMKAVSPSGGIDVATGRDRTAPSPPARRAGDGGQATPVAAAGVGGLGERLRHQEMASGARTGARCARPR